jgi:hypothetical protein
MLLIWTCLLLSVIVDAHSFKRAPPSIEYWSFSDIHKNEIFFKRIMQYHKFNTKVLIFTILKNSKHMDHILTWRLKKWEEIQNHPKKKIVQG